jgi:hypothetical protein
MSKWSKYNEEIDGLINIGRTDWNRMAKDILGEKAKTSDVDLLRTYIKRRSKRGLYFENKSETKPNDYNDTPFILSAWRDDGTIMDINEYCEKHRLPKNDITSYKLITHSKSPYYNCVFKEVVFGKDVEKVREDLIKDLIEYSPDIKTIYRSRPTDPHLLVINPCDVHINKLALESETREEYNIDIAVKRITEGVRGILEKSIGFDIDKILLVIGNDMLHTDNTTKGTTNGTLQDTVTNWSDAFKIARAVYVEIVEMLLSVADIHIVHAPSNHGLMSEFMLADSLYSWFHKSENITWDISNTHRKYWKYGESLIGITHGDGAKMDNLPLLMANEAKSDWATSKFRYFMLGHLHHFKSIKFQDGKDYHGVTVEYLRSPSSADYWHSKNGFQHSKKAIEGFVHSKKYGQVCKITHIFE